MNDDIERSFDDLVRDANQQSDKALYPFLKLHIFGPYQNECYAYLTELKNRMQEEGFDETAICDDRGKQPPSDASLEEIKAFWYDESEEFLKNADVGVFVFLDYIFERENLPSRSREVAHTDDEDHKAINTSVTGELFYWLSNIDNTRNKTLILFEKGIYEELGSVVAGMPESNDVDYEVIENEDVGGAVEEVRQRSMNWVMNECYDKLQSRYYRKPM